MRITARIFFRLLRIKVKLENLKFCFSWDTISKNCLLAELTSFSVRYCFKFSVAMRRLQTYVQTGNPTPSVASQVAPGSQYPTSAEHCAETNSILNKKYCVTKRQ